MACASTQTALDRFVWQPVIVWDVERTAKRADQYMYLNQFSEQVLTLQATCTLLTSRSTVIYNSLEYIPHLTSFTVKKEVNPKNRECLVAVTNNVPIVSPEWLNSLQDTLKTFQGTKTPKELFELPSATRFLPPVAPGVDDARGNSEWWLPNPARELIWKGKTVIMLGGKSVSGFKAFHSTT